MYIDASYWVGLTDARDQWHPRAVALRGRVPKNPAVLDLAVAEAVTIVGSRRGGKPARALYQFFCDSCRIVCADAELLGSAVDRTVSRDGGLSVTDAATIEAMRRDSETEILSFDADFDGIAGVTRVC